MNEATPAKKAIPTLTDCSMLGAQDPPAKAYVRETAYSASPGEPMLNCNSPRLSELFRRMS